jgi:uncharacterized protein with NRDE domain
MCVIFMAVDAHPNFGIIIAANRDEYYDRPTAPVSFWPDAPQVLAGRDLQAGGTWLGITRTGRIAAVTSYRAPGTGRTGMSSRGKLVSDFLIRRDPPVEYLEKVSVDKRRYNGFNLLVGDGTNIHYYSNHAGGIRRLEPGIHGLSNHLMDTPWPKVEKGLQALRTILTRENVRPEDLFHLLLDPEPAPDELLPDTGVGLEKERMLSPVFVNSPGYGTRSSTVILLDRAERITFIEKSWQPGYGKGRTVDYSFMREPGSLSEGT